MRRELFILLAFSNALAFLLMGADKLRAIRRKERIPEAALFFFPMLGGALGGTLGMVLFRHKTRKPAFARGFPLLALVQLAGVIWLIKNVL